MAEPVKQPGAASPPVHAAATAKNASSILNLRTTRCAIASLASASHRQVLFQPSPPVGPARSLPLHPRFSASFHLIFIENYLLNCNPWTALAAA